MTHEIFEKSIFSIEIPDNSLLNGHSMHGHLNRSVSRYILFNGDISGGGGAKNPEENTMKAVRQYLGHIFDIAEKAFMERGKKSGNTRQEMEELILAQEWVSRAFANYPTVFMGVYEERLQRIEQRSETTDTPDATRSFFEDFYGNINDYIGLRKATLQQKHEARVKRKEARRLGELYPEIAAATWIRFILTAPTAQ